MTAPGRGIARSVARATRVKKNESTDVPGGLERRSHIQNRPKAIPNIGAGPPKGKDEYGTDPSASRTDVGERWPAHQAPASFRSAKSRFAGRSASRRMYHGNQ